MKYLGIALLVALIAGGIAYFGFQQEEPPAGISDLGAQQLAQGYLALVMDTEAQAWKPLDDEGLKKKHGISHPSSPCPDFFAPLILQFPDDIGSSSLPSNLAMHVADTPWINSPVQVSIPPDGRPLLPESVPQLPKGYFSDPFFINFNCNINQLETQQLSGDLNITIYNADNSEYRPGFTIPVDVNVFGQTDYPNNEDFVDGFERLPLTCVNPGTPEEDCWNLIVFP